MRFKVIIHQELKYGETIIGYFDLPNYEQMYKFIHNIITHFENVSVSVELDSSILCEKSDGEMEVKA